MELLGGKGGLSVLPIEKYRRFVGRSVRLPIEKYRRFVARTVLPIEKYRCFVALLPIEKYRCFVGSDSAADREILMFSRSGRGSSYPELAWSSKNGRQQG